MLATDKLSRTIDFTKLVAWMILNGNESYSSFIDKFRGNASNPKAIYIPFPKCLVKDYNRCIIEEGHVELRINVIDDAFLLKYRMEKVDMSKRL